MPQPASPVSRRPSPLFVAVGVTALLALAVLFVVARRRSHDAANREERSRSVMGAVAPAPLPKGIPLFGDPGARDADGSPREHVDKLGLRSLLWHGATDELTRACESYQDAFERDPAYEYWPIEAGDAFGSAEPELLPLLDAWVKRSAGSFAPYLARGTYWTRVSYARRGAKYADETPSEDLAAMQEPAALAAKDLAQALALRPKLVAAMRMQLIGLRAGGHASQAAGDALLERALATCPSCYQVRVTHMFDMTPRWGGSYARMTELAGRAASAGPRMRTLAGFVDNDQADLLWHAKKYDEARVAIDRALAFGEQPDFLATKAEIERTQGDYGGALGDLDRAVALRPEDSALLAHRARVHLRRKEWELAGADLLAALRLDPTDATGRSIHADVVQGLAFAGWEAHKAGRRVDAVRLLDLASQLDPTNQDVHRWRAYAIVGDDTNDPAQSLSRLEQEHTKNPDDFAVLQELDYVLSMSGQHARIVLLWTDYLTRHPTDGPAYAERAGASHHQGNEAAAREDAAKACELGVNDGCLHAKPR